MLEHQINGSPFIPLNQLPDYSFASGGRAYYLIIEAQPGASDIKSIEFRDASTLIFDHLPLFKMEPGQKLADRPVKARLDIPVKRITSIQLQSDKKAAIIDAVDQVIYQENVLSIDAIEFLAKTAGKKLQYDTAVETLLMEPRRSISYNIPINLVVSSNWI